MSDHLFVWRADSMDCSVCGEPHSGCEIVKLAQKELADRDRERAPSQRSSRIDLRNSLILGDSLMHEELDPITLFVLETRPVSKFRWLTLTTSEDLERIINYAASINREVFETRIVEHTIQRRVIQINP